ncbi:PKD domain-containing protein [Marivirga arenosa]|uniref:PKD domain-containing protein n=1 Tax=Marivirga arenosa TaxID=3059076 RepID=A0AA51N8X6_9BACT|nr:PKD domain-containing protein [Marivirga sp. ABR2-2]WMN06676.1 PKD domain-containing protein [Marivirga sp. ABR2-2]
MACTYKFLRIGLFSLVLIFCGTHEVFSQCGATSGVGGFDPIENKFCGGEKEVWIGKRYSSVDLPPATDVYILVNWGDGTENYYPTILEFGDYYIDNTPPVAPAGAPLFANDRYAYYQYPAGLTNCDFEITVQLVFVDTGENPQTHPSALICPGTDNSASTVYWERDNIAPGNLNIEEAPLLTICEGQDVVINPLENQSIYNCPLSNNNGTRWFQWVYNTDGANPIPDVNISGINIPNEDFNVFPGGYTNPDFGEIVQVDPGINEVAADLDMDPTGTITIDGTNTLVGQTFEITLRAWNVCNPFDDPDIPGTPDFTDATTAENPPEETTLTIEVVPAPNPTPEVEDPSTAGVWLPEDGTATPTASFCANETVNFRNNSATIGDDLIEWDFTYDGITFNTDDTGNNVNTSYDNSFVGSPITVALRITRGNIGVPCVFLETIDLEISDGPIADFTISNTSACETLNTTVTDISTNADGFSWTVDQISGPGAATDAGVISPPLASFPITSSVSGNTVDFEFGNPGEYEITLTATSTVAPTCPSNLTESVFVYDNPIANFSATEICEGDMTIFTDLSNIPTVVNGDAIDTWEFVFDFDNTDYTTDPEGTFDTQTITSLNAGDFTAGEYAFTYPAAGTYNVALRVSTANGCVSPVDTMSVVVKNNPISNFEFAENGIDYTQPLCPGTPIEIVNTSPAGQTDPAVDRYYVEIVSEDNANDGIFPAFPASFPAPIDSAVINPNVGDLPNPNSGSPYTYDLYFIAVGDNNCETREGPLTVTLLPAQAAGFDIFEGDPGPSPGSTADSYDNLTVYCSPYEFYFRTDANTQTFNADQYIWTITDGIGDTLTETTIEVATDPEPERFNFNFENVYPSVSQEVFTINLQVITDDFCVTDRNETVRLFPKPTAEFNVIDSLITCDSVSYTYKAVQENIDYFWSVNSTDNSKLRSAIQDDANAEFTVVYDRPLNTEPDLDFTVELYTENLVLCQSDLESTTSSIPNADVITVDIDFTPSNSQDCLPSTYDLQNTTTSTIPAGTEWEFEIYKYNTVTTDYDLIETIEGVDQTGNEEFSTAIPYEFTSDGQYRIDLIANLLSNCRIGLSTPVDIEIFESPTPNFRTNISEGCSPLTVDLIENSTLPSGNNFDLSLEVFNPVSGLITQTIAPSNGPGGHLDGITLDPLINTATDPFIDYEITLTATASNALNCSNDSTFIVRVYQEPQIDFDITSNNPACEEDYTFDFEFTTSVFPAGTQFIWNWNDGQTLLTDQDTAVSHTFVNRAAFFGTDTYNVSLTAETPNNCSVTISKIVTLNPRVDASFFKLLDQGCSPLDVSFTSTALGTGLTGNHVYQKRIKDSGNPWVDFTTSPMPNGAVTETFTNTTAGDIIYEVRYIVSSAVGGCSDTSNIQEITIFPEFTSPPITGTNTVCASEQLVPYSVPFTSGSTYLWELPLGAFISNQNANGNEIEVNFSVFSGNIRVTEINANGCFGTPSELAVNVLTGPSATLSLNGPNVICPGDETSLRFDLTGPPGSTNFDVIYNNGQENDTLKNIQNGHIETINPNNSTNYFLVGVVDLANPNCNPSGLSGNAFVNVNTPPTASISGTTTICEGNDTNLIFNLTGVGPWEVVYTDGSSNYTLNTSNPVTIEAVSPIQDTNYELISVTDGNSPICNGTVNGIAEITVNQKPTAEIFGNVDNVCQNDFTEIGVNLTGTAPWTVRYTDGTVTYTLSNIQPDSGYDPATDSYTYYFDVNPQSGTTSYTLTEVLDSSNPFRCSGDISGTATVVAYDRPEVSLSGDTTICFGVNTALNFDFEGDGPFEGTYTANGDSIEFNNFQNTESINVSPETSTVYRIVELFDSRGCPGQNLGGPVSINVNPLPTSVISGNDTTCYGTETNLIFDQTGLGPWTITYTDGNQNYSFSTAFNRHFEPVSPTATTTYSLVSVTDSNNPNSCAGTVSGSALKFVYPRLEASFEVSPQDMVLPESTINITNNTTNKNEWEYLWEFGDGTTSTDVDPAPHDYGTFGEFTIKMTATNGLCTSSFQTLVTIGAIPPIIDFDADPKEGCLPLVVKFENLSEYADPSTYQWSFGDGQRASAVIDPIHVYTNPGTYTVTLSATNITGQRTELIKEEFITVNATPQASFTIPDEYRRVFTTEEVRFVNLSEGADEFIWKFGDGNESFEFEPIHAYADTGFYDITLIAINSETGCSDSIFLTSQVQTILGGESRVPNAFTPSRAGPGTGSDNPLQNDYFLPYVEGVSDFNMKIYNRWGELLFESNDENVGWDGYYQGTLMPQGVYVYRLELVYENGRRETTVGDITLIR